MEDNNENNNENNQNKEIGIGYHTPVDFNGTQPDLPINVNYLQMFILDPTSLFDKTVNSRLPGFKKSIQKWKNNDLRKKMFVHGSYTINLSNPKDYSRNALRNQLKLANEIGSSGLVIHCGKHLKDTREIARQRFINNVIVCMDRATEECPLIIETCVGAGTEVFWELETFQAMSLELKIKCKGKLGICVDTAHVWGAGYDPYEFLISLDPEVQNMIKLIHFNDSKVKKGSKVDRHAPYGEGFIGTEVLSSVAVWANERNIPMVAEW